MNSQRRILVIGSGPIVIGQAAEFDYEGTQACKSLKEEGCYVILVNSNPATIMTDVDTADKVYIEPLTLEIIEKIIIKENPDGILGTLGGQTGLNLVKDLYDNEILKKLYAHQERLDLTCRFKWTENAVAIWDNRSTQHQGLSDFFPGRGLGHERVMDRVAIEGDQPI